MEERAQMSSFRARAAFPARSGRVGASAREQVLRCLEHASRMLLGGHSPPHRDLDRERRVGGQRSNELIERQAPGSRRQPSRSQTDGLVGVSFV